MMRRTVRTRSTYLPYIVNSAQMRTTYGVVDTLRGVSFKIHPLNDVHRNL